MAIDASIEGTGPDAGAMMFTIEHIVGDVKHEYLFAVRTDHRGSDDVVIYLRYVYRYEKPKGRWRRVGQWDRSYSHLAHMATNDFQVDEIPQEVQAEALQRVMDSTVVELPPWN